MFISMLRVHVAEIQVCMLSSKSWCRHLASRIQQNKIEVSEFTTFTFINCPLARAAGLNHLKQPMVQPSLKSVELATVKRVIHVKQTFKQYIWFTLTLIPSSLSVGVFIEDLSSYVLIFWYRFFHNHSNLYQKMGDQSPLTIQFKNLPDYVPCRAPSLELVIASGKLRIEQLRNKEQTNWNSVDLFCLIKAIMYNSFKLTAAEPVCVTVGWGRAATRCCQNLRSSVSMYRLQNQLPPDLEETHRPVAAWRALLRISCRYRFKSGSLKSHWYTQPIPTSNLKPKLFITVCFHLLCVCMCVYI